MSLENQIITTVEKAIAKFIEPSKLYSKEELTEKLGCSISTVDRMIKKYNIEAHEIIPGSSKSRRYNFKEILEKTKVTLSVT